MDNREWFAWINLMPPKPDDFHVVGEVFVSNPGVEATLHQHHPQGINPDILLLDLHLVQQPGIWPQVMTWTQARFDKILTQGCPRYTQVEILSDDKVMAKIDVENIH